MAKRKNNKKRKIVLPLSFTLGIVLLLIYWNLYGIEWLGKIILGGLIFATFTVSVIEIVKRYTKNKKVTIG